MSRNLGAADNDSNLSQILNHFVKTQRPNGVSGLPNDDPGLPEGMSPFLSSKHPAGVNVAMVDGSIRTITREIDRIAYKNAITPNGQKGRGSDFTSEETSKLE